MVDDAGTRLDTFQQLVDETRKLVAASQRLFERNLLVYREVEAIFRFRKGLVAGSRRKIQEQGRRRIERLRRVLIGVRIDEGRLPSAPSAIVTGAPGLGGECDACDGYMPATQMIMAIPDGATFVYLHADCYVMWRAQCHLRAALRRIT